MHKINTPRILLGVALLGTFAAAPLLTATAQAAPPKNAPAYGSRDKDKKGKKDKKPNKKDDRDQRRGDRDDRDDRNDRDDRDDRNDRNNATFSGVVTNVRSGTSFDLRANGRTYNVHTSSGVPRGLSRGDKVSVYGRLYGDNDIRNATVRITDNSRNDPRRDDRDDNGSNGSYRSYSGVVTSVRNSREFDVRIDGRIYNVYTDSATSGLTQGDEVRIYGRLVGNNDIRNATARITRNR